MQLTRGDGGKIGAPATPRLLSEERVMAAVIDAAIPGEISADYDVGKTLGTGHFSTVKDGTNKKTGENVAIKIIKKPTGNKIAMLKAEVDTRKNTMILREHRKNTMILQETNTGRTP